MSAHEAVSFDGWPAAVLLLVAAVVVFVVLWSRRP